MNLPGSRQVALGKKLIEQYAWQRFTPHPEWAEFTSQSPLNPDGKVSAPAKTESPQAAGVPGIARIIYVPRATNIVVRQLGEIAYNAAYFDPVSGEKTPLGIIRGDKSGAWTCPPPAIVKEEDWVLILEAQIPSR